MRHATRLPWSDLVTPRGRALLCITTLGHRRFIDDAVQVVGLPFGSRLLLRYRKRYVAPGLWDAAGRDALREWHALIVLGAEIDGKARFEPLRVGRIGRISIEGEILTLEIALGGFAADGSSVWPEVASIAKSLPSTLAGQGDKSGRYLQALSACPSNVVADNSVEAWERAAEAFFLLDHERKVPYLYLMQGQSDAFKRYRKTGELVVESGTKLEWNIHTKSAPTQGSFVNPLGEVLIEVSCHPMRMVTSRRIRIDSRRDVRRMELACDALFRTVPGHLSVKILVFRTDPSKEVSASDRNPVSLSRHDIPTRAGRRLPFAACLAASVAAAFAMLDKSDWGMWENAAAIAAGVLVFLSLKFGFRGGSS